MAEHPNILWAPWRIRYIENAGKSDKCIFCDTAGEHKDPENLIVYRGKSCFAIMNRYPYNAGHLMAVPFRHIRHLSDLSQDEKLELFTLLEYSQEVLSDCMNPQGFNIGMNVGRLAGAGIESHLHFHVVPRWGGDTNFMPVIGKTKVISEALDKTWEKLKAGFERIARKRAPL